MLDVELERIIFVVEMLFFLIFQAADLHFRLKDSHTAHSFLQTGKKYLPYAFTAEIL